MNSRRFKRVGRMCPQRFEERSSLPRIPFGKKETSPGWPFVRQFCAEHPLAHLHESDRRVDRHVADPPVEFAAQFP
jgi:hypothetical protein